MMHLLRRAATGAVLAAFGFSPLSHAQSTAVVRPDRTEMPRMLPPAPIAAPAAQAPATAPAPFVQQSPNGLYQLIVADTGIVLKGPTGTVTISSAGIQIGSVRSSGPIKIESSGDLRLRMGQQAIIESGQSMTIRSSMGMQLRASGMTNIDGSAGVFVTGARVALGACSAGKPAARTGDPVVTGTTPPSVGAGSPVVSVC